MRTKMLLILASLGVLSAFAGKPDEMRTHYVIADRNRVPLYYATVIVAGGEDAGRETLLLSDTAGAQVKIEVQRNYKNRTTTAEYSVNGGAPLRVKLQLPGNSTSRSEMSKEYRLRPELRSADVPVTIEARGQSLRTSEKEWKNEREKDKVRQHVKGIVDPDAVAALANIRNVLGFPQLAGACSTFDYVTGEKCAVSTSLMIGTIRPDCDFDAKLGAPCSAEQVARAKGQPKDGKAGWY